MEDIRKGGVLRRLLQHLIMVLTCLPLLAEAQSGNDVKRWKEHSARVEIIRDHWGIPHVYGKSDADAVFGLIYAQCEDDFPRVEMNYIEKLGRLAEVNGEGDIWKDLYIRQIIDSAEAVEDYRKSPAWLRALLDAWADGINFYLKSHPEVRPKLLTNFKAWYPLMWTDGSIGAISTGNLSAQDVKAFHTGQPLAAAALLEQQSRKETLGSNGFAIAPSRSASGRAMLYINPHTTFYFRPEVQMVSEEGLHAYGAVTWGQFFIYQGFNEYCGWMHTSSNADVSDVYREKILRHDGKIFYRYEGADRPVTVKPIEIRYLTGEGIRSRVFTTYATHHGPVLGREDENTWLSVRSYNRAMNSLIQSWLRTKARGLDDYKMVMELRGNTSNNTVFADRYGNIAYWHGNYMPVRDTAFDWGRSVDGSIRATEWKGLHEADATVKLINPINGWIQNCNSTPFTAAGEMSPARSAYPPYMAPDGENFRGVNAVRVMKELKNVTLDGLIKAGYDRRLPAFEVLVPALVKAWRSIGKIPDTLSSDLAAAIDMLGTWNYNCDTTSVATTLAVEWGQRLNPLLQRVYIEQGESDQVSITKRFAATADAMELIRPLSGVLKELKAQFGTWQVSWGSYNRYQRLTGDIREIYDDQRPSLPVAFTASTWGCLPAYVSRKMPGTNKRYGVSGNSFVCAVEFGPRVRARSVLAGGVSKDPNSRHFSDQAAMYTEGRFKDVLFYREDVLGSVEKRYSPGK
jgi:acyl-homoserine lactone acylase PvdQ